MALAYGGFDELNHQLRFMLFEVGLGLSQSVVERYINQAHRNALYRLQQAVWAEKLIERPIASHHVLDFLDQLRSRLKSGSEHLFSCWDLLRDEMSESIANEAMALAWRERWQEDLGRQARGYSRFWDGLTREYSAAELLLFLEQWGCVGHPYHPNFRAKMGFNRREVLQYSPEFQAKVSLHWCALRRSGAVTSSFGTPYSERIKEQFPQEYHNWRDSLLFKHSDPDDFYPVPIHPWQWRNHLQKDLSLLIERKDVILMPHHQIVRPSMSFRTMIPGDLISSHLKLATAVHTTSATRTISPASVHNGPALSSWLDGLLKQHNHYRNSLYLAYDLAGLHLSEPSIMPCEQKQMAVILRENPLQSLTNEQKLVPLAALFAPSPLSGKALLFDVINASKLAPDVYLSRYCHCVIYAQLHLMLRHGIAFEAHQQNTLLVFEDNLPTALVIRDMGGICVSQHQVYQDSSRPVLHPDSTIGREPLADLCHAFVHGNLRSNIEYWINAMSHYYPMTTRELWRIVYVTLSNALKAMSSDVDASVMAQQRARLLSRPWQRKCLLSMRLTRNHKDHMLTDVANPLSVFHD